jgi:hypothetical protein
VHREFLTAHGGKAPPTPTEQEAPNLRDEELEELKRGSAFGRYPASLC